LEADARNQAVRAHGLASGRQAHQIRRLNFVRELQSLLIHHIAYSVQEKETVAAKINP
jgi:hypothetical protein